MDVGVAGIAGEAGGRSAVFGIPVVCRPFLVDVGRRSFGRIHSVLIIVDWKPVDVCRLFPKDLVMVVVPAFSVMHSRWVDGEYLVVHCS